MALPPLEPGYPRDFPESLLAKAYWLEESLGARQLAWEYPDILEAVVAVTDGGCIILGVEVLAPKDPRNDPIKDPRKNPSSVDWVGFWSVKLPRPWDVRATSHPDWSTYVQESRRGSLEYVEFVHARNPDTLLYYSIGCQSPEQDQAGDY